MSLCVAVVVSVWLLDLLPPAHGSHAFPTWPGFLVVIAGLHQIYCEFGQIVNTGDPIGLLGGKQPEAQDFLIEASEGGGTIGQESLYIEIRNNGKPVDPTDWFAMSNI